MRYNTGNPVEPDGSGDPRDLYDTAAIADLLLNGPLGEYVSRLGVPLKSWQGIMKQVTDYLIAQGYESVYLAYEAGVVVARQTQLVQRSGELYRVMNASGIPLTLTGIWATDASKLQAIGDAVLRQALAAPSGASIVYELSGGSVQQGLDSIRSDFSRADSMSSTSKSSLNQLVDMHFGVLRGVGLIAAEPGGVITTTTTSAVSSGRALNVESTANFYPGQLICYLATNGEYYSVVIQSKSSTTLALRTDIEKPIANGALVSNFYSDVSHPNVNGFKAIADYSLRSLGRKSENVITWRASDDYLTQGMLTINSVNTVVYENPGSAEYPSIGVTAGSVEAGIISPPYSLPAGNYLVRVSVSPTLTGSTDLVTVAVRETVTGVTNTIGVARGGGSTPAVIELAFHKRPNSTFQVFITSPSIGHQFALSKIEVMRVQANVTSLNKGVHVCLGDSWFANPGLVGRLQERLPNATFINKGVGGNRADQLWDRFEGDVTPYHPNYVWAMAGTNDVAQGYPVETYAYNIGIVSSKINEIGAEAILFNCSVGSPAHPTLGDLLTPSRKYALFVMYLSESSDRLKPGFSAKGVHIPFSITIPASSIRRVAVFPGTTTRAASIDKLLAIGQLGSATGNVRFGFGGSAAAPISEDLQSVALSTSIRSNLVVTKSNANERFLLVEVENTSASALEVIGFVAGVWTPLQ